MRELGLVRVWKSILAVGLVLSLVTIATAQERPRVVAVNQALQFMAERLLGADADVVFPVPAGVDPSFWRPSIADISMIQSSDLILLNGAGFATWIDRVSLSRSRIVNTSVGIKDRFIVTESMTHSHGDGGEHSHEGIASYTWLDPSLAIAQAEAIAAAVVARGLANVNDVETRLVDLKSELSHVDATAKDALSDAQGVVMIATHPRYQYFARRYALSIKSLEWDAGAMPGNDDLTELASLVAKSNARVLIWEAQPPSEAIEAVEAIGLKSVVFEPFAGYSAAATLTDALTGGVSGIADAVNPNYN